MKDLIYFIVLSVSMFPTLLLAQSLPNDEGSEAAIIAEQNRRADELKRVRDKARKLKRPAICEEAGKSRSLCYHHMAEEMKEPSICELIVSQAALKRAASQRYSADHCYRNAAVELASVLICGKIHSKDVRLRCLHESQDHASIEGCTALANSELRESCLLNQVSDSEKLTACALLSSEPSSPNNIFSLRDFCYYNLAADRNEARYCTLLQLPARGYCFKNLAWEQGDKTTCRFIDDAALRKQCYKMFLDRGRQALPD